MSALNCLLCDQILRKNTKNSDVDENEQDEKNYSGPEISVSVLCDSLKLAPTLFTQKEHSSFKAPLCSDCNDKINKLQNLLKNLQRIENLVARLRKKIKAQLTLILDNPKDDDDSEGIRLKIFTDLAKVSLDVSEVENESVIVKSEPISDDSSQEDNTDGFVPDDVDSFGPTVKVETENNFPKDTLTNKDSKKSTLSPIKKRSRKISKKKPTDVEKRLKLSSTNEDEVESNQTLVNRNTSSVTRSGRLIKSTARPEFLYKGKIIAQEPNSDDETGVDVDSSFSADIKQNHKDEIIDEQDQDSDSNDDVNRLSTKRQKKKLSKEDSKKKKAEREYKHIIDPNLTLKQIKLIGSNKIPLKSEDYLVADHIDGIPSINMSMSKIIKDESVAVVKVNEQLYGRRYSCSYEKCNKTFTDKETRDVHYKKRHENNLFPYECEKCKKSFRQKRTLVKHVESVCQENEEVRKWPKRKRPQVKCKNHQCPHCPEKYRGPNELQIHIRKVHTGETPYKCQYCDQSFISTLKLEFHVERSHQEVTPIKCEYCGKGFFREHRLKNHIVVHTGEKPFLCEICCRAFPLKNQLTFHQAIHDEQMAHKFRCEKCNKNFASTQILKQHIAAVHDKLYKYICEVCDHGSAQSSAHRIHMRTHTGEKPFKCEHCDKAFITGSRLTIHLRSHTGERPFVCTICEAAFMTSSRLHRHELIHKKKPIPVEIEYEPVETVQLEEMPIVFVESITFS